MMSASLHAFMNNATDNPSAGAVQIPAPHRFCAPILGIMMEETAQALCVLELCH